MFRLRWTIIAGGWLTVVALGLWRMLNYELTAAPESHPARRWPVSTELVRDPGRPTLLLFLHPGCPCSRATLAELERLLSGRSDRVAIRVIMVPPKGWQSGSERTDLWAMAERIAGVALICDSDGVESKRFGARTSGETMLFTADGRLVYDGGVTGSRGHEGDNLGRDTLAAMIDAGGDGEFRQTPVFGCSLSNHSSDTE